MKRVAFFTNFIPPYRVPVLMALSHRLERLEIYLSTAMETGRDWKAEWGDLKVRVQKSVSVNRPWKHPHGFSEDITIHFPYDTLTTLFRYRPTTVISAEMGARSLQAALFCVLRPKTRLIIWATLSEYTERGRGKVREKLRRWILNHSDAVIVNGESGARYIQSLGFPKDRIFRAQQSTDLSHFLELPFKAPEKGKLKLLYSGRLIELKGLVPFLETLVAYSHKNPDLQIEVCFAGDGPLREKLAELPMPQNVSRKFLGHFAYDKLPELYGFCDALILPTLSDEWGLVVVEALAAGLPVLGSIYSQAVEELIQDDLNGWKFNIHEPASVMKALQHLQTKVCDSTPQALQALKTSCRESVRMMTSEWVADKLMNAIEFVEEHPRKSD